MEGTFDLYRDIAERTDGDVYIGVVGPVRTGKSTLISRMMEKLVLDNMDDSPRRERIADELDEWRKDAAEDSRIRASDEDALHDFAERIKKLANERDDKQGDE